MATVPSLQIYSPPQGLVPLTDDSWRRWLTEVVWPIIGAGWAGSDPQGTFSQLQVGKAQWTSENAFQELINVDQGIYVTYSSTVQQIIYGFACNVHRSGGNSFTVGAQINAWGERGSTGDVYGIACTALVQPFSDPRNIIAFEPDVANAANNNTGQKWCINTVFKDRGDGATNTTQGTSTGNRFNYAAYAWVLTSQARSADMERCGWGVGMQFLDGWCDLMTPRVWSSTVAYIPGDIVSSGGVNWKCIIFNTNSTPTSINTNWVQYGNATDGGSAQASAVGIDFTPLSATTMSRMVSAIRLRNTMVLHWEETASVGTYMDSANGRHVLSANWNTGTTSYVRQLQVDVSTGVLWVNNGFNPLGGGGTATLGKVSVVPGAGPQTATQQAWYKLIDATTSNPFWVPVWQ